MVLCTAVLRRCFEMAPLRHFELLLGVGAPLVLLASWGLHRFVERPGIALGHRLARRILAGAQPEGSSR